jgi:hypothetical protein
MEEVPMKHESIKDLVNMYIEYFLPLQHKECPFFSAQDLEDLKKLSAAEVDDSNPFGDDYNFFVTTYGLMAGYVKGYKQALKDQKKEISRIDKKSKYAGRNVEPSDIAQDLIAERVAEMEAAREEKAAKREAKKAEKANKSPMSTSKNPTEKKTASKKCGTAAKKTEAKKTATKKATTAKKPVTKKANIAEKKPVKKTTKKTEK